MRLRGPVAIGGKLAGQIVPWTGKETSGYAADSVVMRAVKIQNSSEQEIVDARFVVRVLDQSGTEIGVVSSNKQSSARLSLTQQPSSGYQQNPELGKMAMEVEPLANALVIERLGPGQSVEVPIGVPANGHTRAAKIEVFVTYVPTSTFLQQLQQSKATPVVVVTIPVTGTREKVVAFTQELRGQGIQVRHFQASTELGQDRFVVRVTKCEVLTPSLVRRAAEKCGVAVGNDWTTQEI